MLQLRRTHIIIKEIHGASFMMVSFRRSRSIYELASNFHASEFRLSVAGGGCRDENFHRCIVNVYLFMLNLRLDIARCLIYIYIYIYMLFLCRLVRESRVIEIQIFWMFFKIDMLLHKWTP